MSSESSGHSRRASRLNHRAVTVSLAVDEYQRLLALYGRLRRLDVQANNSTPFRAGLRLLESLPDEELSRVVRATPWIPKGPKPRDDEER